jgi:phage/plasmid primase-like uncharacterized protein
MIQSHSDPIGEFRDAISGAGIPAPEMILADGDIHRFSTNGKASDDSGWYVLHVDGVPAGAFGCWRQGIEQKWRARKPSSLSPKELQEYRRNLRASKQRRDEEAAQRRRQAAQEARRILEATEPATVHPYLKKKGVGANGARKRESELVLPIYDESGQLCSLQFIDEIGGKRFLPGGKVGGGYYPIGRLGSVLYVCEGFATGASIREATGAAVAVAFNAGNLEPVARAMRAKHPELEIVLAADNDVRSDGRENTGVAKATEAAIAAGARLVVPGLDGSKCDFNDLHIARGLDAVRESVAKASDPGRDSANTRSETHTKDCESTRDQVPEKAEGGSISTTLVQIALQSYEFGVSTTGETYAVPLSGPPVVSMLRGSKTSLRGQLARIHFREYGKAAPQQALADALLVIEGIAQEAEEVDLHLRVGSAESDIWLDLGDSTGRAVRISAEGWRIESAPPMLFKRTVLNGPLPEPVSGGDLKDLWSLLNVAEPDRALLAAWLVAALFEDIPHPVLGLFGEQGTGKTTAQKMIVMALDPGPVPTRKPPRDPESWVTAAAGSWLVGLDNLSDVRPWLSDSICRAVTGEGDVRRKLYTDGEHSVFAFRRCVCLNGIDLGATRGDLGERMLPINLERISESNRQTEDDLWPNWHRRHPRVLGAILDLASKVLSVLHSVELASKPRMADFARIVAAVDAVSGTEALKHYLTKQGSMAADSLAGDPFILAVMELRYFDGTSADLRDKVTPEKPPRNWPGSPRAVTTRLRRHAPAMTRTGWQIDSDQGQNHDKVLRWTIRPPEIRSISDPQAPQSASEAHDPQLTRGQVTEKVKESPDAGIAGQETGKSQAVCPRCDGEGCRYCNGRIAAEGP